MHRFFVTGTDTGVGKTRVAAALALALRQAGERVTIVKLVQTGGAPNEDGDATHAARLAGCSAAEFARFSKPADPWSAALADGTPPVHAQDLVALLARRPESLVVEGAGGLAVPLNAKENFATVAALSQLPVILAVGLRLGCMNHALLTLELCKQADLAVAGAVLVDFLRASEAGYVADVRRTLQGKTQILGILPFDRDERQSVKTGAALFEELLRGDGS